MERTIATDRNRQSDSKRVGFVAEDSHSCQIAQLECDAVDEVNAIGGGISSIFDGHVGS